MSVPTTKFKVRNFILTRLAQPARTARQASTVGSGTHFARRVRSVGTMEANKHRAAQIARLGKFPNSSWAACSALTARQESRPSKALTYALRAPAVNTRPARGRRAARSVAWGNQLLVLEVYFAPRACQERLRTRRASRRATVAPRGGLATMAGQAAPTAQAGSTPSLRAAQAVPLVRAVKRVRRTP